MLCYYEVTDSIGFSNEMICQFLDEAIQKWQQYNKVNIAKTVIIPPDATRRHSGAGIFANYAYHHRTTGSCVVMPALGTHAPMSPEACADMFGDIPYNKILAHDWQCDTTVLGQISAKKIAQFSDNTYTLPIDIAVNRIMCDTSVDLFLSIGQVVPHEVVGMANHSKNIFVGLGGSDIIHHTHYMSAVYGIEHIMGRIDTPVRRVLEYARIQYARHMPILYVLTVVQMDENNKSHIKVVSIGDDYECFAAACAASQRYNITYLSQPAHTIIADMGSEYQSMWLANKAIYRSRCALADGGQLWVYAPSVNRFGETAYIDALIRKYGYCSSEIVHNLLKNHKDLRAYLAVAAHLAHGSSEGRFSIYYASAVPDDAVRSVGYIPVRVDEVYEQFSMGQLHNGYNQIDSSNELYYIRHPGLGLWQVADKYEVL